MRVLMVLLACVCSSALLAYNELTGQEAPAFNANVCVNRPADGRVTMTDCLGGVVLLKYWGPN